MNAKATFPVRNMDFDFNAVSAHWVDNDPFMTHLFNALSSMFPDGERFFVDSVRAVRTLVADPQLQKDISAFIGQEAMHARQHAHFNAGAMAQGFNIKALEKITAKIISISRLPVFGKRGRLAATVALEHFTGVISAQLMQRDDFNQAMEPVMHDLWLWHCVEENEHKAVAFDVYQAVYGNGIRAYMVRMAVMLTAMAILMPTLQVFIFKLMREDGEALNIRSWVSGQWRFWGYKGFFTEVMPEFMDYFRPGFHPWDHDTKGLLMGWKQRLKLQA